MTPTPVTSAPGSAGSTGQQSALTPDERAAMEDQRDFLLASLEDLEREHEAGDVDDHDYAQLRDDYTARAAQVIRTIEAHEVEPPERDARPSTRRRLLVAAGIAAFVALAGTLVAAQARDRDDGDTLTGDIRESETATVDQMLGEAHGLAADRRLADAIVAYDRVLEVDPTNVEAATYKGWMQLQSGDQSGVVTLVDAAELDPAYPDVHLFLAFAFVELGREDTALDSLDRLAELDVSPEMADIAEDLRADIESR